MRRYYFVIFLVVTIGLVVWVNAGNLSPPPGPIRPSGCIPIITGPNDARPIEITRSGNWCLKVDVEEEDAPPQPGNKIEIKADHVTLDLGGFTVRGSNEPGSGIKVVGPRRNVVIRDGTVTNMGGHGIDLGACVDCQVINVRVNRCGGDCIRGAAGCDGCVVHRSQVSGCAGSGIDISACSGCEVSNTQASGNGTIGFRIGANSVVRHCIALLNVEDGIRVEGSDNRIEENHSNDNGRGILVNGTRNIIIKNSFMDEGGFDIFQTPAGWEVEMNPPTIRIFDPNGKLITTIWGDDNNRARCGNGGCRDGDGDGWGDPVNSRLSCPPPEGYVGNCGDCDDADPFVNPDATETCDGKDNDCDGSTDNRTPGCGVPLTRQCQGTCGKAVEKCEGGTWSSCLSGLDDGDPCGLDLCPYSCPSVPLVCGSGSTMGYGACITQTCSVKTGTQPTNYCGNCDLNPSNGWETDLSTSRENCGACGQACANPHGTSSCTGGQCVPSCTPGFGDCDGDSRNGCETDLKHTCGTTDLDHCGACGRRCTNPQGTTSCNNGVCTPSCNAGFSDCDGDPANGCETDTLNSLQHCGGCNMGCTNDHGTTVCTAGQCNPSCDAGYGDCDGITDNGCESNLGGVTDCDPCTLDSDCLAGVFANGSSLCVSGVCRLVCNPGFANCNNSVPDGCEVNTGNDPANCGTCGNVCAQDEVCVNGVCTP